MVTDRDMQSTFESSAMNTEKIKYGYKVFPINKTNMNSTKKQIFVLNYDVVNCIKCNNKLCENVNSIPISDSECVRMPGKCCWNCESFFVRDGESVYNILANNAYAKDYCVSKQFIFPLYAKRLDEFMQIESAVAIVAAHHKSQKRLTTFIIVISTKEKSPENQIYHYSDERSRELLSALFRDEKHMTARINSKDYKILKPLSIIKDKTNKGYNLFAKSVIIEKEGGYEPKLKTDTKEIVDVLLFSPYTKRYEICRATYDKLDDRFYMDITIFKRFVMKYGDPRIDICFDPFGYVGGKDILMRAESILHEYGYNVGKQDDLDEQSRQNLLSEVVDLRILKTKDVVNLLKHNIKMHPQHNCYDARQKWESDLDFILEYKINPTRFIIPHSINKSK